MARRGYDKRWRNLETRIVADRIHRLRRTTKRKWRRWSRIRRKMIRKSG